MRDFWKQYSRASWGGVEFPEWRPIEFKHRPSYMTLSDLANMGVSLASPGDIITTGYEVTDAPQLEAHGRE